MECYLESFDLIIKSHINVLNNFEIFNKINKEQKLVIDKFHVFDDEKGYNVLLITSDDKVFGFGSNCFGCCGLGHNSVVNEPQIIPELCNKNIQQFFIGSTFALAQNGKYVYSWGSNDKGQCARDVIEELIYLMPEEILNEKSIFQICCGLNHSLALDSQGYVYSWGDNSNGQLGCGKDDGLMISDPILLKKFSKNTIKSIYCSYNRSFALTIDGLVFSWGSNSWCELGLEIDQHSNVFVPTLVNISKIIEVSSFTSNTYFIDQQGHIYFCGLYSNDKDCDSFQKSPKIFLSKKVFKKLYSVPIFKQKRSIVIACTEDSYIFCAAWNYLFIVKKNPFQFYSEKYSLTHKTLKINSYSDEITEPESLTYPEKNIKNFESIFKNVEIIGTGNFGEVMSVNDTRNGNKFAVKKINMGNYEKNYSLLIFLD